mmetsp:Transcript_69978/g.186510  ORF Transcript_69978/g.186510 Transcript_69978/m.186510 type:complete len:102 (+) Transcript_69978:613-918(+)
MALEVGVKTKPVTALLKNHPVKQLVHGGIMGERLIWKWRDYRRRCERYTQNSSRRLMARRRRLGQAQTCSLRSGAAQKSILRSVQAQRFTTVFGQVLSSSL